MKLLSRWAVATLACFLINTALAQPIPSKPGLQPYTPNRIEWLALLCNDQLRQDASMDFPFSLSIVQSDHETLLVFVRYQPNVNREIMNASIDTARQVIMITAKSYGWDKWVKVRERVEMIKPKPEGSRN
ncbi:MAG: hypothetical protein Q7T38_08215 [Gallionella sp.]|nr:hypothetical protein [Gallionella sp.]